MATIVRKLGPFKGLMTSVDPLNIPEGCAQDMVNVRVEDGVLRIRHGITLKGSSAATAVFGLDHVVGYNSSTLTKLEEFISFETLAGNTRAYSIHPTTFVRTEIKDGVSSVNLNASSWRASAFGQYAYLVNPNNASPVYQHLIADATSMKAVSAPSAPTTALRSTFIYDWQGTAGGYARKDYASFDPTNGTHLICTGKATNTGSLLIAGNSMKIMHGPTVGAVYETTITLDFSAATGSTLDFSYNDIFQFSAKCRNFTIGKSSLKVTFTNADGAPISWDGELQVVGTGFDAPSGDCNFTVRVEFKGKTRTEWDNIDRITLSYLVTSTATAEPWMELAPFVIGMVDCQQAFPQYGQTQSFVYSYYNSTAQWEGAFFGITATQYLTIPNDKLIGYNPDTRLPGLGVWVKFFHPASSDGAVDTVRLYVLLVKWKRFVSQSDATTTSYFRMTSPEVQALTEEYSRTDSVLANVKYCSAFKGWMIWLCKGGSANVKHSRVGSELALASDLDPPDDDLRGANFSLADNYGDEPVCGHQAGDAYIILGERGVHAQVGDRPSQMTPPKKVPGSLGVANQFAACRWRDQEGNPGVAFVSTNLEGVYFVQVDQSFDGDQGFRLIELTDMIRPTLKAYFTAAGVRIAIDEANNALWIMEGDDALVLRRPSAIDGIRYWERYNYASGTFAYLGFATDRGNVALDAAGELYDIDRSPTGTPIGDFKGLDSGCYWQSKDYDGPMRRVLRLQPIPRFPVGGVNGPSCRVIITGDGTPASFGPIPATGQSVPVRVYRFGISARGRRISYKVNFDAFTSGGASSTYFSQLDFWEAGALKTQFQAGT